MILILASGGLDSTVLLHHAINLYGKDNVEAISFFYGSKHNMKEISCARWQTKHLGVKHIIINIDSALSNFKSALLQKDWKIPQGHYAEESMKQTVVPLRNGIMLMIAGGYCDSIGGGQVWIASHAGDHFIYLDCRPEFNRIINMAIEYGTGNKVSIAAPFNKMTKTDIVKRGVELGVDFSKTYSCYEGKSKPCGKCGTCNERIESFKQAGVDDPLMK